VVHEGVHEGDLLTVQVAEPVPRLLDAVSESRLASRRVLVAVEQELAEAQVDGCDVREHLVLVRIPPVSHDPKVEQGLVRDLVGKDGEKGRREAARGGSDVDEHVAVSAREFDHPPVVGLETPDRHDEPSTGKAGVGGDAVDGSVDVDRVTRIHVEGLACTPFHGPDSLAEVGDVPHQTPRVEILDRRPSATRWG
jgi:hypothetical protein